MDPVLFQSMVLKAQWSVYLWCGATNTQSFCYKESIHAWNVLTWLIANICLVGHYLANHVSAREAINGAWFVRTMVTVDNGEHWTPVRFKSLLSIGKHFLFLKLNLLSAVMVENWWPHITISIWVHFIYSGPHKIVQEDGHTRARLHPPIQSQKIGAVVQ